MSEELSMIQAAIQARQLPRAEEMCSSLLLRDPDNIRASILLTQVYGMTGRAAQAEKILREVATKNPSSYDAVIALGAFLHAHSRFADAVDPLRQASSIDPGQSAPLYMLGLCLLETGENAEAARTFRKGIRHAATSAVFHHFLGVALQRIGDGQGAARSFREAIRLDPGAALSNAELGHLLLAAGDSEGAVACFKRVAQLQPGSAKGLVFLAKACAEEQNFSEAEAALTKALRIDPKLADAHVLRGRILQQLGKFEEARRSLESAIALNTNGSEGYYALINGNRITETDRPLLARIEQVVASGALSSAELRPLEYALGKAYDDLGEYDSAMRHYDLANQHAQARLDAIGKRFDPAKLRATVDQTIARFPADRVERLRELGNPGRKPIFVVGMARSGTTLLEQMISSHPQVAACGEMGTWLGLEIFLRPTEPSREEVSRVGEEFLAKVERFAPGSRFATIKTPQNYLVLGQILATLPNCKIVHCRRNAIDTCLSIYTTSFHSGPEFAHKRESLVAAYREYLRVMEHWESVIPSDRLMTIRYEALVADPAPILKQVTEFLEVEWSEELLAHEQNDHAISTPSVWQARQPVYGGSVERWKRYQPWLGALLELSDVEPT